MMLLGMRSDSKRSFTKEHVWQSSEGLIRDEDHSRTCQQSRK
jgi:hypothetical protein